MSTQRVQYQCSNQVQPYRYVCSGCYYTYDPEAGDPINGIAPGTPFAAIPNHWVCPECGLPKEAFREYREQ